MKDNQASSTAYTVLQGILYIAQNPSYGYLVEESVVKIGRQILQSSEEGRKRLKQLNSSLFNWSVKIQEAIAVPGMTLHYILRKRHVEYLTRQAIDDGVTQVVMLGAGFDTLSWRLHQQHKDVNFIEIDHPATQREKVKALDKDSVKGTNMHFLSVDFSQQDLQSSLGGFAAFEPQRPTLYICEGVMMYLSEQDIHHMFDSIRQLNGSGTQFVFSTLEPRKSVKNTVPSLLYLYLKFLGEPISWAVDSDKMADFVKPHQVKVRSIAGRDQLLNRFVTIQEDVSLHSGEYFVHCQFE